MIENRRVSYQEFLDEPKRKYILGFNSGEDVVLHYRENGIKTALRITYYPWYLCVTLEDYNNNQKVFENLVDRNLVRMIEKGKKYVKLFARNINKKVMDERHQLMTELTEQKITHYEADLSSMQRCLVDNKLRIEDNYRILYFDIETDDRGNGIEIGRDRILSIACADSEGKVYYYTSVDEKKLLKKFLDRIEDYDIIAGWNSEKFDVPYIRERLKKHNIWYNWSEILQLDLMQKTMELNKRNVELIKEVRSFSLNSISKHFLGEEKVQHEMGIYEMYEKDPKLLKEYNIQDTILLKKLDDKLKLSTQKIVEHQITGCFLNEFAVSRVLDIYTLRNANKFGDIRFRSKPEWGTISFDPNKEAGYVGGYVIDPLTGLHDNIYHFDFTSLYPSIIQTFNISPETWLKSTEDEEMDEKYIYTPNKQVFRREIGIIPKIIGELLKARDAIRKGEMKKYKEGTPEYDQLYYQQYAFKTIANSFYGVLGAPFTRYYKLEIAEAITRSGHYLIKLVKKWFEEEGLEVIYGDTDSVFVKSKEVLDEQDVYKRINLYIDYHLSKYFHIKDSHIDLKLEDHYVNMLMVGKKKYVKNKEGELKIVGLELRRRETLPLAANAQKELLNILILEKRTKQETVKWLLDLKARVASGMTKEELTLQMKLSKHIDEYAKKIKDKDTDEIIGYKPSVLAHAKVANWLKENHVQENGANSWEKGCYVKYIVVKHKPKVEAISIYQFEGEYDHSYYWNVKVYAILQRILECVYPEDDWKQYLIEVPKVKRVSKRQMKLL